MTAPEFDGYTTVTDERNGSDVIPEGATFEAYRWELPNNYTVQVCRSTGIPGNEDTKGYDEGLWEVNFMKPLPASDVRQLFGQTREIAEELNYLCNDEVEGFPLYSGANEAKIKEILDEVSTKPTYEVPQADEADPDLDALFASIFGDGEK